MKTIVATAVLAIGLAGSIGSRAEAETVWHFPYKGAPYATETAPTVREFQAERAYEPRKSYRLYRAPKAHAKSQLRKAR
jgi:hypothetical protein